MMHVKIIAVGRIRERYLREGCTEYLRRLSAYARVDVLEVKEESNGPLPMRVEEEAKRITAVMPERCYLIALDERGKEFTSQELAAHLAQVANNGISQVCFIIGGADGLAPFLRTRADLLLSFSHFTFPHQLFRVMLLEQVYRAFTIQKGEPYHRSGLP